MSVDDQIRQALRHGTEAPPVPGWEDFERSVRGARARKLIAGTLVVALLIAGGILAIPQFGREAAPTFAEGGPEGEGVHFVDRFVGYQLNYPADWVERGEYGSEFSFTPRMGGSPSSDGATAAQPGNFFSMIVHPEQPRDFAGYVGWHRREIDAAREAGADVTERRTVVGGSGALSFGILYPQEPTPRDAAGMRWCRSCREAVYFVDWSNSWVLHIVIQAGTAELFETYGARALEMVASIKPAPTSTAAPKGSVAAHIDIDEQVRTLVDFLEARVAGSGAEGFLGPDAKAHFERNSTLYGNADKPYLAYGVKQREGVDASSAEFTVVLSQEDNWSVEVIIGIGPGENHAGEARDAIVRFEEQRDQAPPVREKPLPPGEGKETRPDPP